MASAIDIGATLRALRRRADLSQRELAERAGVPAGTISRLESGGGGDPRFRTVERVVAAAGGTVTISAATAAPPALEHPDEELVDGAGRHYPAHLDVRPVSTAEDWWGAWWAGWYRLPRHRWPRQAPDHTFDLDRERRDHRRRTRTGQKRVAALRIARLDQAGAPDHVWSWAATDPGTGEVVGWLGGFVRQRRVDREREFMVCEVEVAPAWRGFGLGRRLVDALHAELRRAGVRRARVLIDEPELPHRFFRACGFILHGQQPASLMLPVRR